MSKRIQSDWVVLDSLEDASGDFCVDFFIRPDQSFGFEVFRRAPEDQGLWQPLSHYAVLTFTDFSACISEAAGRFEWLTDYFNKGISATSYSERILSNHAINSGSQ